MCDCDCMYCLYYDEDTSVGYAECLQFDNMTEEETKEHWTDGKPNCEHFMPKWCEEYVEEW